MVEGGLVSANERLANLVDPARLEAAFRVSTAQYVRLLDEGRLIPAPVTVTLDVTGVSLTAEGRISRDSAAVGTGSSGRMLFAGMGAAPGFKPGDFVTVTVEEPEIAGVVRLPASALDAAGTVLVLDEEDRLEILPVDLVRRQGDDVLLRGAGLDGREVVAGRTPLLGPGIKVRPLRQEAMETGAEAQLIEEMLELTSERRARLITFVEESPAMPAEAKARMLAALGEDRVPARLVARIESRMGG